MLGQIRDEETVERGSFRPVLRSSTVSRFRHLATDFGLIPIFLLSAEIEACDRCIAALTACVLYRQIALQSPGG